MRNQLSTVASVALLAFTTSAHAVNGQTGTLSAGETALIQGNLLAYMEGSSQLAFSKLFVSYMNVTKSGLLAVPDATLTVRTSTSSAGTVRYVDASAQGPLDSLTYGIEGGALTLHTIQSSGGVTLSTIRNGATNGSGSLSISDLKIDLTTKTIYADIDGANGVGVINDRALWTYDTITGPIAFNLAEHTKPQLLVDPFPSFELFAQNTLSGLFLVNPMDVENIFGKALNLNAIGRSALSSVNRRSTTNTAGFGSITSTITVAVPEPSSYALMAGGLLGLAWLGRRRITH